VGEPAPPDVVVVGLGNELRGDDGAGIAVARRLRRCALPAGVAVHEEHGDAVGLIDRIDSCGAALIVDCMRSGAAPGTVRRFDASREPLPPALRGAASTHALALGEAIELARVLGRLPRRVIVYGVEGDRYDTGAPLTAAVEAAVAPLADTIGSEAGALAATTGRPAAA
jgi:hydrogenase maturation protease